MKKITLFLCAVVFTIGAFAQNVGINSDGSAPNASAQLDVKSTDKGFLPPRMSSEERDAIASPAAGLVIYNASSNKHEFYDGTKWYSFTSGPAAIAPTGMAYYSKTTSVNLFSNYGFNSWLYSNAVAVNYLEAVLPTAPPAAGFERVNASTLKNVTGRNINVKINITFSLQCTNTTATLYNPKVYFGVNGVQSTIYDFGNVFTANNTWYAPSCSVTIPVNNNESFDIRFGVAGGWMINLSSTSIVITEI
jgi:hypothetical protein